MAGKDGTTAVMDDEAMAAARAMGMAEEELAARKSEAMAAAQENQLDIWPENWRPLLLAVAMQTQVRVTMGGVIGFDYAALPIVEARIECPPPVAHEDLADEFAAFRHIERIYFGK